MAEEFLSPAPFSATMPPLPWHRRLEARVALLLGLLVASALTAVLTFTIGLVSRESRTRAVGDETRIGEMGPEDRQLGHQSGERLS